MGNVAPRDLTLRVAMLVAFFSSIATAVYGAAQVETSPVVALFVSGAPLLVVILWLARSTGTGAVRDWGEFLFLAWPVVIPWYAFKTRGRSGWRLALGSSR